jgi:hypothetical protein
MTALCEICGEPMLEGEEMFKFHGYSVPCPKPPLPRPPSVHDEMLAALRAADEAINPPDRKGISLDKWNDRLKAATKTIRAAVARAETASPVDQGESSWATGYAACREAQRAELEWLRAEVKRLQPADPFQHQAS